MAKAAFGYLKLGDMKGFSTNPRFTDWIPFDSISTGGANPGGGSTTTRNPSPRSMAYTFFSGGARPESVRIHEAWRSGRPFQQAEYWLTGPGGSKYGGHVILTNVFVSSVVVTSAGRSGEGGLSFELNFEKRVDALDPK